MANIEVEAATAAVNALMIKQVKPFEPHGQAPLFDMEERKDSFDVWETQWKIFIDLSTIKDLVPGLKTVVNAGLGATVMEDVTKIIEYLIERCNAGKNKRIWRQQIKSCTQRQRLSIDNWLCKLRHLARKCEFETCCNRCDVEQILDHFLFGQHDREVQLKLFDIGPTLTIDQPLLYSPHMWDVKTPSRATNNRSISTRNQAKVDVPETAAATATKADAPNKPTGATCDKCALEIRPAGHDCPARNATCRKCNVMGHFKALCNAKPIMTAIYVNQVSSAKDDSVTVSIKARGEPATEVQYPQKKSE
jgi:hypothetical protein